MLVRLSKPLLFLLIFTWLGETASLLFTRVPSIHSTVPSWSDARHESTVSCASLHFNRLRPTRRSTLLRAVSELYVPIPPKDKGLSAEMKITHPDDTEIVVVRAPLPFGLDCEPIDGVAKVTKDNENGAREGDVLRYCSQFTMGLPRGDGVMTTAASFGGAIGWQCTMFPVDKAQRWEQVVEALVSNTEQRTDECVLIFERPKEAK
mmetsp:Transcript_705/g.1277  ORF Transcript_705/g.1277 Transcript_705/m.1277 type:complete len:206 (-) Transcript_705:2408-3025(-)